MPYIMFIIYTKKSYHENASKSVSEKDKKDLAG